MLTPCHPFPPAEKSFFMSGWSNQSSILLLTVVSRKYIGKGITITSVLWSFLNALPRICSSQTLWAQWDILEFKSSLRRYLLIFLPCICPITFWTSTILELIPVSYRVTVMPGPGVSLGLRYVWCCAKKKGALASENDFHWTVRQRLQWFEQTPWKAGKKVAK